MRNYWFYITLIILAITGSACGARPVSTSTETPVASVAPPATATAANNEADLLLWEGPALFAEDQTECHRLRVTNENKAFTGLCAGEPAEVEFVNNQNGGLTDMVARFAPFQTDTPQGRITFNGKGEITGPAWERAITNWAQFTYAELATGHVGAANRTVLAWNLGEQNGQCRMLLVLSHGYATAGLTPCAGGQMEVLADGWIDTADWEQFDTWLYNRAPLYQDNNYFDGRGSTDMHTSESAALADWVETVYAKLAPTDSISEVTTPTAISLAICPVPAAGQQLLLSREPWQLPFTVSIPPSNRNVTI